MPGYQDLLSGFSQRKAEVEQENYQHSVEAGQTEQKLFSTLLGSDDPEIQRLAMTGLLDSANPKQRKKGLRGWLGELEQSPHLPAMRALINTPVTEQKSYQLPGEATGMAGPIEGLPNVTPTIQQTPAATGSAGMSATSLVDTPTRPAGPPPPLTYTQPPPTPYTVTRPRQVFMSPIEKYQQEAVAKAGADIEGDVQAYTPYLGREGAVQQVLREHNARRGGVGALGTVQAMQGQLPDGSLAWGILDRRPGSPTMGQFLDADTGLALKDFTPRATTASVSFGADRNAVAPELFGKSYGQLTPTQQAAVNTEVQRRDTQQAGARTTAQGTAAADVPLSTQQRYQAINGMQDDWRKVEAPHREIQRQFNLMQTGLQRFKAGDKIGGSQAVLVTFQKILDPTSVVRESEYDRSPEGLGLLERMRGSMQRLTSGGAGVPEEELAQMVETARQFVAGMTTWNAAETDRIRRTAEQFKIDPSLILGGKPAGPPAPTGQTTAPAASATPPPVPQALTPSVGEVVMYQGKRYKVVGVTNGNADLELVP